MSVYFKNGKGWRYDFTLNRKRHTEAWFKTKREAMHAEAKRKEEILYPKEAHEVTDITFFDFINEHLDHIKIGRSDRHYKEYWYMARRWVKEWGKLSSKNVTRLMILGFVRKRRKISSYTANKEIRYLRATFNYGLKMGLVSSNPLDGIEFFPVEKRIKYVPPLEDIWKVISVADQNTKDYLIAVQETLGRMSEINNLTWDDVDFNSNHIVLYTRKKKGGHLTPRHVAMTSLLRERLKRRFEERDPMKPWIFWHRYCSSKTGEWKEGPYGDRKRIMRTLCRKAGVKYFRFHAIRHAGASLLENNNVPITAIQKILGHENRSTTETYLHTLGEAERLAMLIFERAREKSHTDSHTVIIPKDKGSSCGNLTLH